MIESNFLSDWGSHQTPCSCGPLPVWSLWTILWVQEPGRWGSLFLSARICWRAAQLWSEDDNSQKSEEEWPGGWDFDSVRGNRQWGIEKETFWLHSLLTVFYWAIFYCAMLGGIWSSHTSLCPAFLSDKPHSDLWPCEVTIQVSSD